MAHVVNDDPVEMDIDPEVVFFIITKARAFDAKVPPVEPDPGSNPSDDGERGILEDYPSDATGAELKSALDDLNDDAAADLMAMVWIGRGDFSSREWADARALASERAHGSIAAIVMGIPNVGDLIEEAFTQLGYSCEEFEMGRL